MSHKQTILSLPLHNFAAQYENLLRNLLPMPTSGKMAELLFAINSRNTGYELWSLGSTQTALSI